MSVSKTALTSLLIAGLAAPSLAGGMPEGLGSPDEVVAQEPTSSANLVVPLLLVAVLIAVASGGSDTREMNSGEVR